MLSKLSKLFPSFKKLGSNPASRWPEESYTIPLGEANIVREGDDVTTVYALDLPGHGNSEKVIDDPSLDGFARLVLEFADVLQIGQLHLVGQSLGGAISLAATKGFVPSL